MYYIGNGDSLKAVKNITLFFANPEYMHLGDHLFFEPLCRFLNIKGFNIKIIPTRAMEFYFTPIGNYDDLNSADLVITRTELYGDVSKLKTNILLIDTAYSGITGHLCQDIVNKVASLLFLDSRDFYAKPSALDIGSDGLQIGNGQYMIFNNYVDSGGYRLTSKHYDKLARYCQMISQKLHLEVIHTGSATDKHRDSWRYDFVHMDIRGKTTPADMFYLAGHHNVVCNVSFDNFLMHLFFIYGKKSYVLFRGRFFNKSKDFIIKYVNPPFKPSCNINDLIEYI